MMMLRKKLLLFCTYKVRFVLDLSSVDLFSPSSASSISDRYIVSTRARLPAFVEFQFIRQDFLANPKWFPSSVLLSVLLSIISHRWWLLHCSGYRYRASRMYIAIGHGRLVPRMRDCCVSVYRRHGSAKIAVTASSMPSLLLKLESIFELSPIWAWKKR